MISVLISVSLLVLAGGPQEPASPASAPGGAVEFPERALQRGIEFGNVVLNCGIVADGRVTDCRIISEDPAGVGFGQAALNNSRLFRVRAESAANASEGARVTFTIRFRVPDDVDAPSSAGGSR